MANPPRMAVLYALERCRRAGAWSAATIESAAERFSLDRRDASFAARLTRCVLENEALCDFYIGEYCSSPLGRLEPKVLDILRISVCQILFMDKVPSSAAVNEGVELARGLGYGRAAGMVNAILRRISANADSLPKIPGEGTAQYLATKYSHPLWFTERIMEEYGYEFAQNLFIADNAPNGVFLQLNTLKMPSADIKSFFAKNGKTGFTGPENADLVCFETIGNLADFPGFEEGFFYVQDPAAKISVDISGVLPGMRVLDACAAPGGKSFAAAIKMENKGEIISRDIHAKKAALIEKGAKRLGIDIIKASCGDAKDEPGEGFDVVIADVPCSGMGVIRKKPEIRHKTAGEIEKLPEIQLDILKSVSRGVKPGGVLLYSTCTVLREENQGVIEAFLSENKDFSLEEFEVLGKKAKGCYTFFPHIDGTDGFFVCKMRKNN